MKICPSHSKRENSTRNHEEDKEKKKKKEKKKGGKRLKNVHNRSLAFSLPIQLGFIFF
jgi:hypothetical protein